jgi:hypothetical protein
LGLKISHHWHQHPFWFASLDTETQSLLIAHWRLEHNTPKQNKDLRARAQSAQLKQMQDDMMMREAYYDTNKNQS